MLRRKRSTTIRIILHIGSTKTGSSALQEALWRHRRALARQGVLYPEAGVASNAHHLIAAAGHANAWMMHRDAIPEDGAARAAYLRETVQEAGDRARSMGAAAILLSSEYFWGVYSEERIAAFKQAFDGHPVTIVALLREPVAWLKSSWLQAVKSGETRDLEGWIEARKKDATFGLNFHKVLKSWEDGLSAERVLALRYADAKDDLFAAFLGRLGLNVPSGAVLRRVNPSPDAEGAAQLLALNRAETGGAGARAQLLGRHAATQTAVDDLPEALIAAIRDGAAEWHEALCADYLEGARLF